MTRTNLTTLMESHWQQIQEFNRRKGKDYAGDADALSNFKRIAAANGVTPYQLWGIYFGKHIDAINTFIRNNGQVESEPIEERLHDVIVYSFLLLGLIAEEFEQQADAEPMRALPAAPATGAALRPHGPAAGTEHTNDPRNTQLTA